MNRSVLIIFSCLFFSGIFASEISESFVVRAHDDHFKVVAPNKFDPQTNLVIENKTLVKLYAKVVTNFDRLVGYVSIEPSGFESMDLKLKKNELAQFIPLSPSFQEVDLIFGKKSYEIPPKK